MKLDDDALAQYRTLLNQHPGGIPSNDPTRQSFESQRNMAYGAVGLPPSVSGRSPQGLVALVFPWNFVESRDRFHPHGRGGDILTMRAFRQPPSVAPFLIALVAALSFGPDVPANAFAQTHTHLSAEIGVQGRGPAKSVLPLGRLTASSIDVIGQRPGTRASLRLYADAGEIDDTARAEFERVAAHDDEPHALAARLEQLVFKAAYRFKGAPVDVVSSWRQHAGRHSSGEALDFKLRGVPAATLAAYLRGLSRVGVGIYTHPRTQFVHLDVRDQSYHWLDASPPGIKWHEKELRDSKAAKRDENWTPDSDLPE